MGDANQRDLVAEVADCAPSAVRIRDERHVLGGLTIDEINIASIMVDAVDQRAVQVE